MKKIIALVLICLFTLVSCGSKYTEAERFGAKAAYAISRHIGSAETFNISACDYYDSGTQKIFRAECNLRFAVKTGDAKYERHVYSVGTGEYFDDMFAQGKAILDDTTKLYIVDGGDFSLSNDIDEKNKVNQKNVNDIFKEFLKKGDLSIFD
jgi:hypothetical protein